MPQADAGGGSDWGTALFIESLAACYSAFMRAARKTAGDASPDPMSRAREFLRSRRNVAFAYLFGSRAAGKGRPDSDMDIAVMFRRPLRGEKYLRFYSQISDAVSPADLDLVTLNDAGDSLAGRILQTGRVLADNAPEERKRFESVTLRRFFDFRIRERAILERKLRD